MVPAWVRGQESLEVQAPVRRELAMLGLGNSVGGDVRAELVVVAPDVLADTPAELMRMCLEGL